MLYARIIARSILHTKNMKCFWLGSFPPRVHFRILSIAHCPLRRAFEYLFLRRRLILTQSKLKHARDVLGGGFYDKYVDGTRVRREWFSRGNSSTQQQGDKILIFMFRIFHKFLSSRWRQGRRSRHSTHWRTYFTSVWFKASGCRKRSGARVLIFEIESPPWEGNENDFEDFSDQLLK